MEARALQLNLEGVGAPEILDSLADGAYITDTDRRIVFWSRAAERITGWSPRDVVGRMCSENLLVHVDKDGHQLCGKDHCPLHRAMVTGQVSLEPLLVYAQHKDGHRVPVEVAVAPLHDSSGKTIGGVEVFRDLTTVIEDLRRAKAIQESALNSDLPRDDRLEIQVVYTPEDLVGGDFYRVEALEADLYALMVADVMGHGVASALYTMQLRSLWEECREEAANPARFAMAMNSRLYRLTSPEGYFATAVFITLNARTGDLVYVRAGHASPILLRAGGELQPLEGRAPALGLFQNAEYVANCQRLGPGDGLLLYTDGAVEIHNPQGEELETAGLLRMIRNLPMPLSLVELEQHLLDYTDRIRLPDDLTLISLWRKQVS